MVCQYELTHNPRLNGAGYGVRFEPVVMRQSPNYGELIVHGTSLTKRLATNKQETLGGMVSNLRMWHGLYARRLISTFLLSVLLGKILDAEFPADLLTELFRQEHILDKPERHTELSAIDA